MKKELKEELEKVRDELDRVSEFMDENRFLKAAYLIGRIRQHCHLLVFECKKEIDKDENQCSI